MFTIAGGVILAIAALVCGYWLINLIGSMLDSAFDAVARLSLKRR